MPTTQKPTRRRKATAEGGREFNMTTPQKNGSLAEMAAESPEKIPAKTPEYPGAPEFTFHTAPGLN